MRHFSPEAADARPASFTGNNRGVPETFNFEDPFA